MCLLSSSTQDIFGNKIEHLWGLSFLYQENIFIYAFLGFVGLATLFVAVRGP